MDDNGTDDSRTRTYTCRVCGSQKIIKDNKKRRIKPNNTHIVFQKINLTRQPGAKQATGRGQIATFAVDRV